MYGGSTVEHDERSKNNPCRFAPCSRCERLDDYSEFNEHYQCKNCAEQVEDEMKQKRIDEFEDVWHDELNADDRQESKLAIDQCLTTLLYKENLTNLDRLELCDKLKAAIMPIFESIED